jgi:hypothetical protein
MIESRLGDSAECIGGLAWVRWGTAVAPNGQDVKSPQSGQKQRVLSAPRRAISENPRDSAGIESATNGGHFCLLASQARADKSTRGGVRPPWVDKIGSGNARSHGKSVAANCVAKRYFWRHNSLLRASQ